MIINKTWNAWNGNNINKIYYNISDFILNNNNIIERIKNNNITIIWLTVDVSDLRNNIELHFNNSNDLQSFLKYFKNQNKADDNNQITNNIIELLELELQPLVDYRDQKDIAMNIIIELQSKYNINNQTILDYIKTKI